ncbi:hypothetical protein [Enterococcus canintestini]|uniref:hypothetical protein n=1 Tax=Enterococcus canintestini TaxID=317010 RepID=UPI00288F0908|nr:hypothetical protein [Enterococcus canintestini]MDT2740909.1 hypothetical protein [Enterococcus canintestini]
MTEEELSVLNRIKGWSVLLKIYYGILFFSFVTVGLFSLLLTLLSLWTNMMLFLYLLLLFFLGLGGVGTAILDDYKWSLFSGICRRMKKSASAVEKIFSTSTNKSRFSFFRKSAFNNEANLVEVVAQ